MLVCVSSAITESNDIYFYAWKSKEKYELFAAKRLEKAEEANTEFKQKKKSKKQFIVECDTKKENFL